MFQEYCVIAYHRLIPIILPLVVEIVLHFHLEFDVESFAVIELNQQSKELRKIVAIIEAASKCLDLINDGDEVTHNVGEYGYSEE